MEVCAICNGTLHDGQPTVKLKDKGAVGVNKASKRRRHSLTVQSGQTLHKECRRLYTREQDITSDSQQNTSTSTPDCIALRSSQPKFVFKEHCLFCGAPAKYSGKKKGWEVFPVRTSDFRDSIEQVCKKRSDDWSEQVLERLAYESDLHAVDAVYHHICSVSFRTGKEVPKLHMPDVETVTKKTKTVGRPEDTERNKAFLKVTAYLEENDDEQITIGDLINKMREYLENTEYLPYSSPHMKSKLKGHFGDKIIITTVAGKPDVTFWSTDATILQEFYHNPKQDDSGAEKQRLVETVAKLLVNDIKAMSASTDFYPKSTHMSSVDEAIAFLPKSLQMLLRSLFSGKDIDVKLASLGQAIMQATWPRVLLAPLQLGLGIQMHHHFASRFLIDSLHSHGFCSSYTDVKNFERSAAVVTGTDIPDYTPENFVQYAADKMLITMSELLMDWAFSMEWASLQPSHQAEKSVLMCQRFQSKQRT